MQIRLFPLGRGYVAGVRKFHCLKCTWAGQGIHLLKMMARMAMAAITKKARPPSAEPTISGSRSCTISERSPGKEDTHTHRCRGQELCRVSLLLTEISPIIPSEVSSIIPSLPISHPISLLIYPYQPSAPQSLIVLLQCLLSYTWEASAPSESTFSSPGPLTADKPLKHRLALHLGCNPTVPY